MRLRPIGLDNERARFVRSCCLGTGIFVRMRNQLQALDAWIAKSKAYLPEAIRRLIEIGLKADCRGCLLRGGD
jgi:hypothetical protein